MNSNPETFGDRLCLLRKQKGLSQKQLADILGYKHHASISNIEANKTPPDIETLTKIADILNADLHWLITGKPASMDAITQRDRIVYMQLHKEYEEALIIERDFEEKKAAGQILTSEEEKTLLINKGRIKYLPRMMQNFLEQMSKQ